LTDLAAHSALFVLIHAATAAPVDCARVLSDAICPHLNPVGDEDSANDHNESAHDFDRICENSEVRKIVNPKITEPSKEIAH